MIPTKIVIFMKFIKISMEANTNQTKICFQKQVLIRPKSGIFKKTFYIKRAFQQHPNWWCSTRLQIFPSGIFQNKILIYILKFLIIFYFDFWQFSLQYFQSFWTRSDPAYCYMGLYSDNYRFGCDAFWPWHRRDKYRFCYFSFCTWIFQSHVYCTIHFGK